MTACCTGASRRRRRGQSHTLRSSRPHAPRPRPSPRHRHRRRCHRAWGWWYSAEAAVAGPPDLAPADYRAQHVPRRPAGSHALRIFFALSMSRWLVGFLDALVTRCGLRTAGGITASAVMQDPSMAVDYHYGNGRDEGSTRCTHRRHCGARASPSPVWHDVTAPRPRRNARRWIIRQVLTLLVSLEAGRWRRSRPLRRAERTDRL